MADQAQKEILKALEILERTYQALRKTARINAQLLTLNGAKCTSVRQYNLLMMATYNAQTGWMELLRAKGVPGIPASPPFPTLFALNGVSGQESLTFDCSKMPKYVGTNELRIITSDRQLMVPGPEQQVFERFDMSQQGELSAIPFVAILIAGITTFVFGSYLVSDLSEDAKARQLSADDLKTHLATAEQLERDAKDRLTVYSMCLGAIDLNDPVAVANCKDTPDKVLPRIPKGYTSKGEPIMGAGIVGTLGKLALAIAVVVGGFAIYKRHKAKQAERAEMSPLPPPPPGRRPSLQREVGGWY